MWDSKYHILFWLNGNIDDPVFECEAYGMPDLKIGSIVNLVISTPSGAGYELDGNFFITDIAPLRFEQRPKDTTIYVEYFVNRLTEV